MGRGRKTGRGSQVPLTPACPPTFPLQAQTRAALLRVLQENEEHWGNREDRPSSLAQDVCEVGGGEEEGESVGTVPPVGKQDLPPPHPFSSPWTTQLLEEHTERAPRISQEFGERMAHCCLGGLAEFLQRYRGPRWGGAVPGCKAGGGGISTQDPTERGDMKENQVRTGRGASGRIPGFAGLSAQQETLLQQCSICHALPFSVTSFQQRVERFHENPGVRELLPDTYISRTISLVNCGPPLR